MKHLMNDVRKFHELAEHPVAEKPTKLSVDRTRLRLRLILEEFEELVDALYPPSAARKQALDIYRAYLDDICTPHGKDDVPQPLEASVEHFSDVGDALVDLSYFIAGMGLEMGLPMDRMWDEVQRANMDKFPGGVALRRPDGKVVKPEGWKPPDHAGIIRQVLAV